MKNTIWLYQLNISWHFLSSTYDIRSMVHKKWYLSPGKEPYPTTSEKKYLKAVGPLKYTALFSMLASVIHDLGKDQ